MQKETKLIEINPQTLKLELELYYATANNLTGNAFYKKPAAYLHNDAYCCLEKAVRLAESLNFSLVIWDAFRPLEGQIKLWEILPDARYISPPGNGPQTHCRGVAVDLTLKDNKTGQKLEMGSDFDDMSELAHHGCTKVSKTAQRNRLMLAGIMHTAGFEKHDYEWWHYQLPNYHEYKVLSDAEAGIDLIKH